MINPTRRSMIGGMPAIFGLGACVDFGTPPPLGEATELDASSIGESTFTSWVNDPARPLLPPISPFSPNSPHDICRTAGILASYPPSHPSHGPFIVDAANELLSLLDALTNNVGGYLLVDYASAPNWTPPAGITWAPPWQSAYGNAQAAMTLMHLSRALDSNDLYKRAELYLRPTHSLLSAIDDYGYAWYRGIADDDTLQGFGIINEHFTVVNILYERWLRSGDSRYLAPVHAGLDTLKFWWPRLVVAEPGKFAYYARDLDAPDYSPARVPIHSAAAGRMRSDLKPVADDIAAKWAVWAPANGYAV